MKRKALCINAFLQTLGENADPGQMFQNNYIHMVRKPHACLKYLEMNAAIWKI